MFSYDVTKPQQKHGQVEKGKFKNKIKFLKRENHKHEIALHPFTFKNERKTQSMLSM